ncbi:MAG: choice-of-anchor tandem repeat GloVer-containing protein [Candidatus Korobacteraceae bacterium]
MPHFRELRPLTVGRVAGTLARASALAIVAMSLTGQMAQSQTYTLYAPGDGAKPEAGVTIRGQLVYGTTTAGGTGDGGLVFEATHVGDLYNFMGALTSPLSRVVFGPDDHLYGTTPGSGSNNPGFVYDLIPNPTICKVVTCQPWKATLLYEFSGYPDGAHPGYGDLIWDQRGNIYGTTTIGGTKEFGVVYEMMPPVPPSKTWTESVIWNFTGPDGENPQNAVVFDANGHLLGTAKLGGANGLGTVFKLTPSGNTWTETNVYDFQGGSDGQYPIAGLTLDSSGNIYGATSDGGSGGGGTVFELIPSGNSYTFKLLYGFSGQQGMNCGSWGTLAMDAAGSLYGTTYCDGVNGLGNIFKLTNTQNGWTFTSLHDFPAFNGDGIWPISNVTFDAQGNLWGTASAGHQGTGAVWMIKP